MALVSLAQAKRHLRITGDDGDADIALKVDQAQAIILDYLDTSVDPLWVNESTTPGHVSASILMMLARLYEHRGDADEDDAETWQAIERLLVRSRNAALA